ncbi:MAG: hypothetical protein RI947_1282 [Candidatus Parcubacteria bacterium]|jgi:acylphosphatase
MLTQAHVYIKGDVIGAGFRAWIRIQAKMIGVNGWVRDNFERPEIFGKSGGIEAVFQGDEKKVEEIVEAVKQGPAIAHVVDVEVIWQDPKDIFETLEIRK